MANVEIKLNTAGVRELLKSKEIQDECRKVAQQIQGRVGDGYVVEDRNYHERSGAAVRVDSPSAYRDNLKNNTLLKAVQG